MLLAGLRGRRALLTAAIWLSGCSVSRPPTLHPSPATLPDAAELCTVLQQRRDKLHGLRALVRLRYRDPEESHSSRQALIVERPSRVRVEVLSLLGTAFLLTADDSQLVAYSPSERTVYRGTASPENLWRYTRLWMPVADLVDIVLATPAVTTANAGTVSFEPQSGEVRLQHQGEEGEAEVGFSQEGLPVSAQRRGRNGRVLWNVRYQSYEVHTGLPIATQIALDLPQFSRTIDLSLSEIEINPALDARLFALQTPAGSRVVNLDQMVD